jgi:hypothetical protein
MFEHALVKRWGEIMRRSLVQGSRRGVARLAALVLAAAGIAALSPAQPAQAGGSCTLGLCSTTYNYSDLGVYAVRHWTCDSGTTGTASTGCVKLTDTKWIYKNQRTPSGQDWDAFRVDAGYCYLVELHAPGKKWHMRYDRRGMSTPVYVKVENWGTAYVRGQSRSSCP